MHAFPPSSDIQFLLAGEARLSQIIIDPHQLTLGLDNSCGIVSEHRAQYENGGLIENYSKWSDTPSLSLHRLLARRLISARTEALIFTLEFEGDARMTIFSNLLNFEAGQIYGPDDTLIVF